MWPRIHLDVLADSRNVGCPVAEPGHNHGDGPSEPISSSG